MSDILKKEDLKWKVKNSNNIKGNSLEYWYTTYHNGDSSRKYYIIPQYRMLENGCVDIHSEPELYIYFEALGRKLEDGEEDCKYSGIGDGYVYEKGTFKRAYRTIEEAKERAYEDYRHIYSYVMSFVK